MNKNCNHCGSSGNYVDYGGPDNPIIIVPCKYCKGMGYIDEDEMIEIPRKYIKDEYFNTTNQ
jgi:DnaJ-class molecular chaperone